MRVFHPVYFSISKNLVFIHFGPSTLTGRKWKDEIKIPQIQEIPITKHQTKLLFLVLTHIMRRIFVTSIARKVTFEKYGRLIGKVALLSIHPLGTGFIHFDRMNHKNCTKQHYGFELRELKYSDPNPFWQYYDEI